MTQLFDCRGKLKLEVNDLTAEIMNTNAQYVKHMFQTLQNTVELVTVVLRVLITIVDG